MDPARLAEEIVGWIRERVNAAGCRGVVLGLSGGIDSSVLAVLCQRACLGRTLGVIMPCYSLPEDRRHAEILARKFSIPTKVVSLDPVYDAFLAAAPVFSSDAVAQRLAGANLKARLRMCTLYYIANQLGYLVAGSGNRSELTVGYFTKFGDSSVDILPLGNLVKAQVRELAHFLKIPRVIIEKPPSAGLWEGQTDEAEMGLTYAQLDRYILTGEAPDEVREKIERMKSASRHKTVTPPLGPSPQG